MCNLLSLSTKLYRVPHLKQTTYLKKSKSDPTFRTLALISYIFIITWTYIHHKAIVLVQQRVFFRTKLGQNSTDRYRVNTIWKPLFNGSFSYIKCTCVFNEILWGETSKKRLKSVCKKFILGGIFQKRGWNFPQPWVEISASPPSWLEGYFQNTKTDAQDQRWNGSLLPIPLPLGFLRPR